MCMCVCVFEFAHCIYVYVGMCVQVSVCTFVFACITESIYARVAMHDVYLHNDYRKRSHTLDDSYIA